MFQLDSEQAKITSFNPRAEKHGEENVPAGDIRVQVACPNTVLDHFGKGLRPTLYRKPGAGESDTTDVRDVPGNLTQRVLPQLKPLRFEGDWPGYTATIVPGMGLTDPIELDDIKVSNFQLEPMDGGTVVVTFSMSCHPDEEQSGRLCSLIQNFVELTLTPPKAENAGKRDERQAEIAV